MDFEKLKEYGDPVLRIGLALVFLWFSISQLIAPENWIGYLPNFLSSNPTMFVYMNASFELVFGILLILGIFTRTAALLLGLHLIGIIFSLGYNEVAVRDFGLMMASFAVALNGPDKFCLRK